MESTPQKPQNIVAKIKKLITANPKKTGLVVAGVLAVSLAGWGTYSTGYNNGHKAAESAKPSTLAQAKKNDPALPVPVSGEVTDVKGNQITVKMSNNQSKTFTIDDKTKIAKKATVIKASDIQKGSRIVVFTLGSNKDTASRIVVQ